LIRRFDLREGVLLEGTVQASPQNNGVAHERMPPPHHHRRNGRHQRRPMPNQQRRVQGPRLVSLTTIEGVPADEAKKLPNFDTLTPVDPRGWLRLETMPDRMTTRVVDMFTPIGKGTRGLIVAPPRSGKTILIQHIADAISDNHPDVELFVLLVDERPEEVTEMRRSVRGKVFASSNDRETASHVRLAQLVIERAKRLAERGKDVVVLLDSITRLARAYNKHVGNTGRTMSGGLDVKALDIPKRLFGSARAFDEGGSLTVMATALIETGSRMDDVIFQEFKGTGNMELVLDRKLSERRIFPAIDICGSGTRKEERLLPPEDLERITILRRSLIKLSDVEAMETMLKQLKKHPTNKEFLAAISKVVA
jgi:transcription termination factor Rho